jgi:hypothetical protein
MIICKSCGELKPHNAFGLCINCYRKQNLIICKECGELKPYYRNGYCNTCYNHKMGICQPYNENKTCAAYLGTKIEKLLIVRFKNTVAMPYGHKGFDFLCDKGYKIDAKSSSLTSNNFWMFRINKNQIANYFFCVGIDNREDMNIINAWLIPSDAISKKGIVVNELVGLKISQNQTAYWDKYKKDINSLNDCCNSMK